MKCPACGNNLSQKMWGNVELDVCQESCGGIWFDTNEIVRFDEPHEFSESDLLAINRGGQITVIHDKPRNCPKCEGHVLIRQFFDIKNQVEIDQCWNCGGIWLDTGELIAIRNQFASYEERAKSVNEYLDTVLASHHKVIAESAKTRIAEHELNYSSRVNALISGLRELLGK